MGSNVRKKAGGTVILLSPLELTRTYCNEMLNVCQILKYLTQRGYDEMHLSN